MSTSGSVKQQKMEKNSTKEQAAMESSPVHLLKYCSSVQFGGNCT